MTNSLELAESDLFKRMVFISAILHFSVFLVLAVKTFIFPNEKLDLDTAVRVDMVALPDKVQRLPPQAPVPEPLPKVEPKIEKPVEKPQPIVLTHKINAKQKALEKIKKFAKEEKRRKSVEEIEEELKKEEAEERAARQKKIRDALLKGNAISPGTTLHGLAKAEFNEYVAQLHNHVSAHWNLPEWLQNDSLKATVIVYIDFRGVVMKRGIEKSSGDERFDDFALKAVDESSPFPKPPDKFLDLIRIRGIVLGFPQ